MDEAPIYTLQSFPGISIVLSRKPTKMSHKTLTFAVLFPGFIFLVLVGVAFCAFLFVDTRLALCSWVASCMQTRNPEINLTFKRSFSTF